MPSWNLPWAYQPRSKVSPVHNPAFWDWFRGSVVRNPDGSPRIVYHGTTRRGHHRGGRPISPYDMANPAPFMPAFTTFKAGYKDIGIHFGTQEQAQSVIGDSRIGIIYPAYIRLENPLRMNDTGGWSADTMVLRLAKNPERIPSRHRTNEMEDLLSLFPARDPANVHMLEDAEVMDIIRMGERNTMGSADGNEVMRQMIVEALNRRGYDGIVYVNRFEGITRKVGNDPITGEAIYAKTEEDSYIVFDPRQIKAVYGNRGTFDPNDPDILNGVR